jgi:hypothetical protein
MSRLNEEMKIIPRAAWRIATILCIGVPLVACLFWVLFAPSTESRVPPIPILFVGALICATLFVYILLLGYIAGDARRRGMRPVLWVLLSIFIPNAIGIILYFIMREPLLRTCSACGTATGGAFAFCPTCGAAMSAACPSCRGAVEPGWTHCARCGAKLQGARSE